MQHLLQCVVAGRGRNAGVQPLDGGKQALGQDGLTEVTALRVDAIGSNVPNA